MCGAQEECWECLKVSTHQKDVRIINIYTPHKKVTKWMKQILIKMKEVDNLITLGNLKAQKLTKSSCKANLQRHRSHEEVCQTLCLIRCQSLIRAHHSPMSMVEFEVRSTNTVTHIENNTQSTPDRHQMSLSKFKV